MSMKEPSKEARELVNKWVYGIHLKPIKSEEHDLAARIDTHTEKIAAERDALREGVRKALISYKAISQYALHRPTCGTRFGATIDCTCGLDDDYAIANPIITELNALLKEGVC